MQSGAFRAARAALTAGIAAKSRGAAEGRKQVSRAWLEVARSCSRRTHPSCDGTARSLELRSLSGRKRAYVSMFLGHCSHGFGS